LPNIWCFSPYSTTRSCRIAFVHCPYCSSSSTRVVDSRLTEPGDAIRRRRECEGCGQRFTTYERAEAEPVTVRKRGGKRERFDRQKLLRGLTRAANKRPVSDAQLESLADAIAARVRRLGPEADAELIGELALRGLAGLDPVSGVMFASVYRNFNDLGELEAELQRIRSEPVAGVNQLALDGPAVPSDPNASIDLSPRGQRRGGQKTPDRARSSHA
jgi:transcriptional repressor NrdR